MALFLYRRDLRLEDNPALTAAVASGLPVYPIFITNPAQVSKTKNPYHNKRVVDLMMSSIPEGTMVFKGSPVAVIKKILKTGKVSEIYLNRDYTPFAEKFQEELGLLCKALGAALYLSHEATLLPPGTLKTTTGDFFKKFTPFKEKFLGEYRNKTPTGAPNFSPGKLPEELGYTVAGGEQYSRYGS